MQQSKIQQTLENQFKTLLAKDYREYRKRDSAVMAHLSHYFHWMEMAKAEVQEAIQYDQLSQQELWEVRIHELEDIRDRHKAGAKMCLRKAYHFLYLAKKTDDAWAAKEKQAQATAQPAKVQNLVNMNKQPKLKPAKPTKPAAPTQNLIG